MELAKGREGILIIIVFQFVVVVLRFFEDSLFYHKVDVALGRLFLTMDFLGQ